MTPDLCYAAGGILGAALRSGMTTSQEFLSRKTIVDLVVGALIGVVYPLFPVVPLPMTATLLQQTAVIAVLSYAGGDFVQNILNRMKGAQAVLGPPPTEARR